MLRCDNSNVEKEMYFSVFCSAFTQVRNKFYTNVYMNLK